MLSLCAVNEVMSGRRSVFENWADYCSKQESKFIRQNNTMTILIQGVNNTMAGYQKEILPSSWSPVVKYNIMCIILTSEVKEALGAKAG